MVVGMINGMSNPSLVRWQMSNLRRAITSRFITVLRVLILAVLAAKVG
jgi:hypothetical protein